MDFKMQLNNYTFFWNPDKLDIPEEKKVVATSETYKGSAVFQWEAFLEGTTVELWWNFMPDTMYTTLRGQYLSTSKTRWLYSTTSAFDVYIVDMKGKFFEIGFYDFPYRDNVSVKLNIRAVNPDVSIWLPLEEV